jgi:magnesium-transporting ATPase (P-type)
MADDLYSQPPATSTPPATVTTPRVTTSTSQSTSPSGIESVVFDSLYFLNVFLLAWTMFYSAVLVTKFFFFWVKFPDGEYPREKQGAQALLDAAKMWWGYLLCIVLMAIGFANQTTSFGQIVGGFTIIVFLGVFFGLTLPLTPVLSDIWKSIVGVVGPAFKALVPKPAPPAKPDKK